MAYSTANPPRKMYDSLGGGLGKWTYTSTDAIATVRGAGYFSNAGDLGMKVGDQVESFNSTGLLGSVSVINAITAGAATVIALT